MAPLVYGNPMDTYLRLRKWLQDEHNGSVRDALVAVDEGCTDGDLVKALDHLEETLRARTSEVTGLIRWGHWGQKIIYQAEDDIERAYQTFRANNS